MSAAWRHCQEERGYLLYAEGEAPPRFRNEVLEPIGKLKMMLLNSRITLVVVLIGSAVLLTACGGSETEAPEEDAATMQEDETMAVSSDPVASGEEAFMQYCASCHGQDGRGNGPVADVMTVEPANLTQLRARSGGTFPVDSVYAYIDGRADVQAHGTRAMPVWGNVWGEEPGGEPVPREEVDLRIRQLVEYIRSIQEEPAS